MHRLVLPLLGLLAAAAAAHADEDTVDMTHAIYVTLDGSSQVPFIDPDSERIAGTIDLGLVPRQVEIAASIGKLVAIDGKTPAVNIVDVVTHDIRSVALNSVPGRVTVSPDGLTAALADTATGHVVLLDLLRRRTLGETTRQAALQDMVFSADSRTLYIAGKEQAVIDVINASTARPEPPIATGLQSGSAALTRAPNGTRLYVQPDGGDAIGVLDLEHRNPLPPIPVGPAPTAAFPSAGGAYLLVADNERGTLTILRAQPGADAAVITAATGVTFVYTAWFDSLAMVPSAKAHSLLLYDLDSRQAAGAIALAALPGRGGITPDGQKLYLPLSDAKSVAVIDARRRTLAASISVPGRPISIVLAGSYGLCH